MLEPVIVRLMPGVALPGRRIGLRDAADKVQREGRDVGGQGQVIGAGEAAESGRSNPGP